MTFESQSAITLVYHATQVGTDFSYAASFTFRRKILCANFSISPPSGKIAKRHDLLTTTSLKYKYIQSVWVEILKLSNPKLWNSMRRFVDKFGFEQFINRISFISRD